MVKSGFWLDHFSKKLYLSGLTGTWSILEYYLWTAILEFHMLSTWQVLVIFSEYSRTWDPYIDKGESLKAATKTGRGCIG